jgi:integrase
MAQFRKYKSKKKNGGVSYQAVIRLRGHHVSRTFDRSDDCREWAREVERAIDVSASGKPFDKAYWLHVPQSPALRNEVIIPQDTPHRLWTLSRALTHYLATETPKKKGAHQETKRINAWLAHPLAKKKLIEVTRDAIKEHIKARTEKGRRAMTIRNEVLLLSALYRHAREEWRLDIPNPVLGSDLPSRGPARKRRLEDGHDGEPSDEEKLLAACEGRKHGEEMRDLIIIALETGMREGEILRIEAGHVRRLHGGAWIIHVPKTKNDEERDVVLSPRARETLQRRSEGLQPSDRLFSLNSDTVVSRFRDFRDRAGLPHIRFHDLRHEAVSRMAARGLTIGELKNQSGHKTASVLLDYVNARASDISAKLR